MCLHKTDKRSFMNKTSKFNKKDSDAATSISNKSTNKVNKQPSSGDENAALDAFFKEDDSDDYDDDDEHFRRSDGPARRRKRRPGASGSDKTSGTGFSSSKSSRRRPKGKRKRGRKYFLAEFDLIYGTARTHARTHDTKRNDFPVGLTPQPSI